MKKQKSTDKEIEGNVKLAFRLLLIVFVAVDFFAGKSVREPGTLGIRSESWKLANSFFG